MSTKDLLAVTESGTTPAVPTNSSAPDGSPASGVTPADGATAAAAAAGSRAAASPELVLAALSEVYDPEIGIDIVSLGLVYGSNIDTNGLLTIDMTLTTPYCPMASIIQGQAHAVCHGLPGVDDVKVNIVFTPPWDPRTMASEEAKLELGIY